MSKRSKLTFLKKILCEYFDEKAPTVTLAEYIGINTNRVDLDGDVCSVWNEIIDEACKNGKLQELVREAIERYPENLGNLNDTDWSDFNYPKTDYSDNNIGDRTWFSKLFQWLKEEKIVKSVLIALIVGGIVGVIYTIKEKMNIEFPLYETTSICVIDDSQNAIQGVIINIPEMNIKDKATDEDGCFNRSGFSRRSDVTFTAEKDGYESYSTGVSIGTKYKFTLKRKL